MSDVGFVVAVVGAASELGRDLREVLIERGFPVAEWKLLDDRALILDGDEDGAAIEPLDEADWSHREIVFCCGSAAQSQAVAEDAVAAGAIVIDVSQGLLDEGGVPLIVPEVNAAVADDAVDEGLLASPLPAAVALAVALNPLEQAARLRRVQVTCLEPVSSAVGGVEELARQTGDLLSGRDPENKVWPQRIAFNLLPQVGELSASGSSEREWQIQAQLRSILDLPDLPVRARVVRVPTFYGLGLVVDVETDEPIDGEGARALLREAPGVQLHEGDEGRAFPTLSDAVGSEATHVGRVYEDPTVPCGIGMWLVIDGLRKGAAVNAVQIGECVARRLQAER